MSKADWADWEKDPYIQRQWDHCVYVYRLSEKDKEWAHVQASCYRKMDGLCARVAKMPDGKWGVYTREKGY